MKNYENIRVFSLYHHSVGLISAGNTQLPLENLIFGLFKISKIIFHSRENLNKIQLNLQFRVNIILAKLPASSILHFRFKFGQEMGGTELVALRW